MSIPPAVAVGALLEPDLDAGELVVDVVAGRDGLGRLVRSPHVQKTGLALAGFPEYIRSGRVLVFGESEVRFLESRDAAERHSIAAGIFAHDIPCILLTAGLRPVPELVEACQNAGVPLLVTPTSTGTAIAKLTARLEFHLAERATVHGVLVDLLGLGVLILGESGIGKSECGLELISRGHRLVADDVVEVRRRAESYVDGAGPATARFFMEVRGLGLIDIQALFGVSAVCTVKQIGLVVRLERWEERAEHERLGLDDEWHGLVGVRLPLVRMPVAPGRSVATLVEVAARNELLKAQGYHAARTLTSRLGDQARVDAARRGGDAE
jgi:HPr kinase/phosphorylase